MQAARPDWEHELTRSFPGWLLPASVRKQLSLEAAERFFARLTGRRDHLQLLRAASTLQSVESVAHRFVEVELPSLLRVLPARSTVVSRTWEGGFQGRLDIQATRRLHHAGQRTRFVTRTRRRDLALPENLLLRHVCDRLQAALRRVLSATTEHRHWLAPLAARAHSLRMLQKGSTLREIPPLARVTGHHLQAARRAAHPAYTSAAELVQALHDGIDSTEPARVIPHLAAGALWPVSDAKRLELAVLCRLVDRVARRLGLPDANAPASTNDSASSSGWTVKQGLFAGQRAPAVTFTRSDLATLQIWLDRAPVGLETGRRFRLANHYLGAVPQRPDLSLRRHLPGQADTWALVEVKHTDSAAYVATGLGEALLYAHEYADQLSGWPKVALVTSKPLTAPLLASDPVVAVDWERWANPALVDGLLGPLTPK